MMQGKNVLVIDNQEVGRSSVVAAGIINPITGKKFVKSWKFDELQSVFVPFYRQVAQFLGENHFFEKTIYRTINDTAQLNEWNNRLGMEGYRGFMEAVKPDLPLFKTNGWIGQINNGYQLMIPKLLDDVRSLLKSRNSILEEKFDYEKFDATSITYKNIQAERIIFCEGFRGSQNPYFKNLDWIGTKGEVLLFEMNNFPRNTLFKSKMFATPFGQKNQIWFGANYENDYANVLPTPKRKEELQHLVEETFTGALKPVAHLAAIRPTNKDRRPYIGSHPNYKNVHILNGLGAKGSSLAPFLVLKLYAHIFENGAIENEFNVQRCTKLR